ARLPRPARGPRSLRGEGLSRPYLQSFNPTVEMSAVPDTMASTGYFARSLPHAHSHRELALESLRVHSFMKSPLATSAGNFPLHAVTIAFFASSKRCPWKEPRK